jgi:predicted membrane channel-forming protein YqfA (hemolysin III family)
MRHDAAIGERQVPSFIGKLLLFLSSYSPLAAIFVVQLVARQQYWWALLPGALGIVGVVGILVFIRMAKKINPVPRTLVAVSRKDGEAMSYVASYLLPFVALPSGKAADVISLLIFLLILGVLYVNSGMIHINPVLNLLRWHVHEVQFDNGDTAALLSRKWPRKDTTVRVAEIGDTKSVFLEVE